MPKSSRLARFHPFLFCVLPIFFTVLQLSAQERFLENGEPTPRGVSVAMYLDTPTRTKVDLSGEWLYTLDGKSWDPVKIPASYDFVEKVTFMRPFDLSSDLLDLSTFTLVAYGINYDSEIFINDVFVGKHVGGYTSFEFPIPENTVQVGKNNVIKIVVDNHLNAKSTIPLRQQVWGWRNYGGIFRDIYLLVVPRIWIDDVQFRTTIAHDLRSAVVEVTSIIDNVLADYQRKDSATATLLLNSRFRCWFGLYDRLTSGLIARSPEQDLIVARRKTSKVESEVIITNPRLWRPDSPELYVLKVYLMKDGSLFDEFDLSVGIRDVSVKGPDIYLNGAKLFLQGVLWREDHPKYGSAMTYDALEKDVLLMKSLGANTIRIGSHPPHPYILSLCDRYGLLVMEEIPVWNAPAAILGREYYQELAKACAREMVLRDRNHPSVLAWGIGENFDSSESESKEYVRSLRTQIEAIDERPIYSVTSLLNNDIAADEVDIAAINISASEIKQFKEKLEDWKQKHPTQPVVLAGYGKVVEPGNYNGYSDPMSMESQARYLIQHFGVIKEAKIAGGIIAAFADWRGDRPIMTVDYGDRFLSTMGLVSYGREKRVAFEKVRALYNNEKIAALTMGTYSENAPITFVIVGFVLLIGFAYLLKSHRRFRDNVFRSFLRPYNFFADIRDQRSFSRFQTTVLGIVVALTLALVGASLSYHVRNSSNVDYVLTHFLLSDVMKAVFSELIWHPLKCIVFFSILFALGIVVTTTVVKLFSLFVQTRVYFFHAYSITVWSGLPLVLLIPVGMVMYRVMETGVYVVPLLILTGAIGIWVVARLLKSMSIIYDVAPIRVYAGGVVVLLVVLSVVVAYYNYTQSTVAYYKFFMNYIQGTS